jgi:uncharacterized protein YjbI with pentapeptide repeats
LSISELDGCVFDGANLFKAALPAGNPHCVASQGDAFQQKPFEKRAGAPVHPREWRVVLDGGVEKWNAFRRANPDLPPDLSLQSLGGLELSGYDLTEVNLAQAGMEGSKLVGARLAGANLSRCDLSNCEIINCDFRAANLYGAFLAGSRLDGCDFRAANLFAATLNGCDISNVRFDGARLPDSM